MSNGDFKKLVKKNINCVYKYNEASTERTVNRKSFNFSNYDDRTSELASLKNRNMETLCSLKGTSISLKDDNRTNTMKQGQYATLNASSSLRNSTHFRTIKYSKEYKILANSIEVSSNPKQKAPFEKINNLFQEIDQFNSRNLQDINAKSVHAPTRGGCNITQVIT